MSGPAKLRRTLLLSLLALSCSCRSLGEPDSAAHARHPGVDMQVAGLPAPSALPQPQPRWGSYVEADLLLDGADYETALSSANVSIEGDSAVFSPSFSAASSLNDAAYCIYRFSVPGYDRNPELRVMRTINPAAYADSWVALANWNSDRWDWFPDDPDGRLDPGSMEDYLSETGDVCVVMLATGSASFDLLALRLGGVAPVAEFSATPETGRAPLSVEFDASASSTAEGSISKYEWDVEGDGVFETDTADSPQHQHEYSENGLYQARLRVTNSSGISAVSSVEIDVNDFWQHSYSLGVDDFFDACVLAPSGTAYFAGSCQRAPGGRRSLLLMRVEPGGQLAWASGFEGSEDIQFAHIGFAPDGDLIVAAGLDAPVGQDGLIQRWTAQGTLVWSRTYGSAQNDFIAGIACGPTNWYIGGDSAGGGDYDLYAAQLDYDGNFIWSRRRDLGDNEYANSFTLKRVAGVIVAVTLLGSQFDGDANHPWMTEWLINGDFSGAVQFDDATSDIDCGALQFSRPTLADTGLYYIGGSIEIAANRHALLLAIPASGQSVYGTIFPLTNAGVSELVLDPAGNITMGISWSEDLDARAALASFSKDDGSFLAGLKASGSVNLCRGLDSNDDGLLFCGVSKDTFIEWEALEPTVSNLTMSFVDAPGTGTNLSLASSIYNGTTTDLTAEYSIDDNSAVIKACASFMSAL